MTKEANARKSWNQSQNISALKRPILGHPVIQAVEAELLGPFYKKFIFLQNILSLKKVRSLRVNR